MLLLTWTVRDLGGDEKRAGIRNFCSVNRVDIVCLQETKMALMSNIILRSLDANMFNDWSVAHAVKRNVDRVEWK